MQKRHLDRRQYFKEQKESSQKYVLPYIQRYKKLGENCRVLEIGCGEGGNLYPFAELGCQCYGVELQQKQINNAVNFYNEMSLKKKITFLCQNIYDTTPEQLGGKFDVIFLRDVIEHIPNQEKFMRFLKDFLLPDSVLFFAFPPWRNPFGGHQQMCKSKILSRLPYFHLLPQKLYRYILKKNGEGTGLLDIRSTGISIARFEKILKTENYKIMEKTSWLFNPNYQVKYGLPPTKVRRMFRIPYLQDFYTTAMYYLIEKRGT